MRTRGTDVAAELPDLLPDPVIGCDSEGTIVYWSWAAETTYGFSAAEALGQRAASLLHTRFPAPLWEITEELADLGRWQGHLQHQCKDGRTVSVHRRWVLRCDDQRVPVGSLAVDRELPDHAPEPTPAAPPEAESAPRALAHELNNALAIVINYAAFVAGELESPHGAATEEARQSMRADLREVQAAAERALEATRRMLG